MDSRAVVKPRGNGVVGNNDKQKKNLEAEKRNRQALGDIRNLATVAGVNDKPQPEVSRLFTRGFWAQLCPKAQEAPADENNEKAICAANVDGAQNKQVIVKPKPETVIELSSNDDFKPETGELKQEKPVNTRNTKEGSSRKKVQTMTSVLTARSKVACSLINKSKAQIVDIDGRDANNELAVVEYVEDIYIFYKCAERENHVHDYMKSQPEANASIRALLVDWLIEVHHEFKLMPETLYLTINIVDRFLSVERVPRRELQLLGAGAMLIASKYEEIWAPTVRDFAFLSASTYSYRQLLAMEKAILDKLEWTLTVPTPYVFLVRFIKASIPASIPGWFPDMEMEHMAYFYAELGLVNYAAIMYCPSMLAASSVYAARCTLKKSPVWNETLEAHTGYSEEQLLDCAKLLAGFHSLTAENVLIIKALCKKYSMPERLRVLYHQPAKALLAAAS